MPIRTLLACMLAAFLLAACGGDVPSNSRQPDRLLAASDAAPLTFPGVRADYSITETLTGYVVYGLADATYVPANARLRFADTSLAFDLDGVPGQAFRLYRTAFARTPDAAGLGYWIGRIDAGASLATVAGEFISSAEFKTLYGDKPGNAELVDKLYRNVLHRAGEPAGIAYWTGVLDRGAATRAQVLGWFSESAENKAGQQGMPDGISYLEAGIPYVPHADPGPKHDVDLALPVTLDGSASTVAVGKPIVYYWSLGAKPAGSAAVLAQPNSAHPSFVPDVQGKYELKLVVSDGTALSREARTTITTVWTPGQGQVPASGNYVYLESDAGDFIGDGATYTYTQADAVVTLSAVGARLYAWIQGDMEWSGTFELPQPADKLKPGFYGDLNPFGSPGQGSIAWSRKERGCAPGGWIKVDSVAYDGNTLSAVDLRFGQHCASATEGLRGQIHWAPGDGTRAPGPAPVPAPPAMGSWQPPPGATPDTGNYVYLLSEVGDPIGGGKTYTFTNAGATLDVQATGAQVTLRVTEPAGTWSGDFVGMNSLDRLVPGYYGGLLGYSSHNPAKGGLRWGGLGRECYDASGWFAVDQVTYANGAITRLDLRFVQHCNGSVPVIHGKIHWVAG